MELFGDSAARLSNAAAILLGWGPNEFWDATPAELELALRTPDSGAGGPDRVTMEALQQRFPDEKRN